MGNNSPIFIGGTGRSGTTIVAKMLGGHSQVFTYPLETRFIIDPDGLIELVPALSDNWSPYIGSKAIKRFKAIMHAVGKNRSQLKRGINYILKRVSIYPQRYAGIQLGKLMGKREYEAAVNTFIRRLVDTEFSGYWCGTESMTVKPTIISPKRFKREEMVRLAAEFIRELFGLALERQGKKYYVDHTPYNILHGDFLKEMFPDVKIVNVYRDIRDVICSYKTKEWGGNEIAEIVYRLKQVYLRWDEVKAGLPVENYYELAFEKVIENPGREMGALFRFLGIDYEEGVTDLDLSKGHIGRWKTELNKEEQSLIEKEFEL
jgi:hypothetical protein